MTRPGIIALIVAGTVGTLIGPHRAAWAKTNQLGMNQLIAEAADAFAQGDWPAAIADYNQLIERGAVDPRVDYNLGTAYAHAGDKGRAIWMLIRAKRLAPRDRDIRDNLRLLAPDLASQIAIFPLAPIQAVYGRLTRNEWAWLAGAATVLTGVLLAWIFTIPKSRRIRPPLKRVAATAVLVAAVAHNFAAFKYYEETYSSRGVVVDGETHPRVGPGEKAQSYDFILPAGTVIRVESAGIEGWIKAIYGNHNEVFIRRNQMEYLND